MRPPRDLREVATILRTCQTVTVRPDGMADVYDRPVLGRRPILVVSDLTPWELHVAIDWAGDEELAAATALATGGAS